MGEVGERTVPVFAVIGHPNEGKSAVLSTLAEDDSVRVSPIPGETTRCQAFPVRLDGTEMLRFIDTPGFQNPRRVLTWLQDHAAGEEPVLAAFIAAHRDDPDFADDCELLRPVADGAGVIFVVDGSRPVRNVDLAEMEILRLSAAPRMAVINSKEAEPGYLEAWRGEFRRHFNAVRVFNANRATYAERIELLESLRSIDQMLEPALNRVISGFRKDWADRSRQSAMIVVRMLDQALGYRKSAPLAGERDEEALRQRMFAEYVRFVSSAEEQAHARIRKLYRHNIFRLELPPQSILQADLFSEQTWQFLGLSQGQLILAGALGGATIGAGIDVSTAGLSHGLFSALGGLAGALGTAFKGRDLLGSIRVLGIRAGGEQLQVGPVRNIQLLFIMVDRALLLYGHVINWAHGRRDYGQAKVPAAADRRGYTGNWTREERAVAERFFRCLTGEEAAAGEDEAARELAELLERQMQAISEDRDERTRFLASMEEGPGDAGSV